MRTPGAGHGARGRPDQDTWAHPPPKPCQGPQQLGNTPCVTAIGMIEGTEKDLPLAEAPEVQWNCATTPAYLQQHCWVRHTQAAWGAPVYTVGCDPEDLWCLAACPQCHPLGLSGAQGPSLGLQGRHA